MKLKTIVIVDEQCSMLTMTVLWLEDCILIYQRNMPSIRLPRSTLPSTANELYALVRQSTGRDPFSGTHAAAYWVLMLTDNPPPLLNVSSTLEAIQFKKTLGWQEKDCNERVYADVGTLCTSIDHWQVGDQEYWLLYCRQNPKESKGGEALVYHKQTQCVLNLLIYPYGAITELEEFTVWLAELNGPFVYDEPKESLRFYWSLSYGPKQDPKPLETRVIEYQRFQQTVHLPFYRFKEQS